MPDLPEVPYRNQGRPSFAVRIVRRGKLSVIAFSILARVAQADVAPHSTQSQMVKERLLSDRISEITLKSEPLGGRALKAIVIRPAGVVDEGSGRRPVLYFLHGRGRNRMSLVERQGSLSHFLKAPFWVVLPDGEDGWYLDSPVRPAERYGSHLSAIIQATTDRFGFSRDPSQRAIGGWSMGGYGATRHAQTSPDLGVLASVIGLLDFPRRADLPEGRNYQVPVDRFGTDPARWAELNPINSVEKLRGKSILIVTAEAAFDAAMNENFSAALNRAKIPHRYEVLPGSHHLDVVEAALPRILAHVAEAFSLPPDRAQESAIAPPLKDVPQRMSAHRVGHRLQGN